MHTISIYNQSAYLNSIPNPIVMRVVKLTLWNIDGTTSEVKLTYPNFCNNGDSETAAALHLEEWIRTMTRYYVNVTAYQAVFGVVYKDGTERFGSMCHEKQAVPEGRIFVSGSIAGGKWMTPEEIKQEERSKNYEMMETGKNIVSRIPSVRNSDRASWQN